MINCVESGDKNQWILKYYVMKLMDSECVRVHRYMYVCVCVCVCVCVQCVCVCVFQL